MNLRDKLARLSGVGPSRVDPDTRWQNEFGGGLGSPASVGPRSSILPGIVEQTPLGPIRLIESYFGLDDVHGTGRIGAAYGGDGSILAALALQPELADVAPQGMLYLDTETTGLAGGTGTLPFLTGLSWYDGKQFVIQQAMVMGYGQEEPLLALLSERLANASCIVSFNGKSFDWPLLRSRFVMYRLPVPEPPPHLDLLHCIRRVSKRRLASFRLVALERALLGYTRVGDVDGSEIPGIYFEHIHTGEAGLMPAVIEHNRLDLLAMPALLGWLVDRWKGSPHNIDAQDLMGFASIAERSGQTDRAQAFARAAIESGHDMSAGEARIFLAKRARRDRAYDREVDHLLAAIQLGASPWVDHAHLRLAITYEHTYKCMERALKHALLCGRVEEYDGHQRRLRRLTRRMEGPPLEASVDRE